MCNACRGNLLQRLKTLQKQLATGKVKLQAVFMRRDRKVLNAKKKRARSTSKTSVLCEDILCSQQSLGSLFSQFSQSPTKIIRRSPLKDLNEPSSPFRGLSQLSLPFTQPSPEGGKEDVHSKLKQVSNEVGDLIAFLQGRDNLSRGECAKLAHSLTKTRQRIEEARYIID